MSSAGEFFQLEFQTNIDEAVQKIQSGGKISEKAFKDIGKAAKLGYEPAIGVMNKAAVHNAKYTKTMKEAEAGILGTAVAHKKAGKSAARHQQQMTNLAFAADDFLTVASMMNFSVAGINRGFAAASNNLSFILSQYGPMVTMIPILAVQAISFGSKWLKLGEDTKTGVEKSVDAMRHHRLVTETWGERAGGVLEKYGEKIAELKEKLGVTQAKEKLEHDIEMFKLKPGEHLNAANLMLRKDQVIEDAQRAHELKMLELQRNPAFQKLKAERKIELNEIHTRLQLEDVERRKDNLRLKLEDEARSDDDQISPQEREQIDNHRDIRLLSIELKRLNGFLREQESRKKSEQLHRVKKLVNER